MQAVRARMSRHADVGKAMDYMLKRWNTFSRFPGDGRICLANNAAERASRGVTLGRKAWLLSGSDRGCERGAAMYSLIGTAKLNDVDPRAWLADRIRSNRASVARVACRFSVCGHRRDDAREAMPQLLRPAIRPGHGQSCYACIQRCLAQSSEINPSGAARPTRDSNDEGSSARTCLRRHRPDDRCRFGRTVGHSRQLRASARPAPHAVR